MILKRKLYFERTKEMEETVENLKHINGNIVKSTKEVIEKVKHPGETARVFKKKVVSVAKDPKKIIKEE